jgi:hypothetical protein
MKLALILLLGVAILAASCTPTSQVCNMRNGNTKTISKYHYPNHKQIW